jgi:hypothetical protein
MKIRMIRRDAKKPADEPGAGVPDDRDNRQRERLEPLGATC